MTDRNPASILFDTNSVELAVTASIQIPSASRGLIAAGVGSDGIVRYHNVDSTGALKVTGSLTTTPSGVQQVTGSVSLSQPAIVSGTVNLDRGNNAGTPLFITGSVGISGSVGITNQVTVTTTGSLPVTGSVAVTGSVGITNRVTVVGAAASGSAFSGNPVLVAGIDISGSARIPRIDFNGAAFVRQDEEATFVCTITGSAIGNNKAMLSIYNATGSNSIIKIREIWIQNIQAAAITGVNSIFEFHRITGHSGGSLATAAAMDTVDNLNALVSIRTNGTVTGEVATLLWRTIWSSDEWGTGTTEDEDFAHAIQATHPIYFRRDSNTKPITLYPGQGLNVKHAVNATQGSFDVFILLTQVP